MLLWGNVLGHRARPIRRNASGMLNLNIVLNLFISAHTISRLLLIQDFLLLLLLPLLYVFECVVSHTPRKRIEWWGPLGKRKG